MPDPVSFKKQDTVSLSYEIEAGRLWLITRSTVTGYETQRVTLTEDTVSWLLSSMKAAAAIAYGEKK